MRQLNNSVDFRRSVWDVILDVNVSDESIESACVESHPTCQYVFRLHGDSGGAESDVHTAGHCVVCEMVEGYAVHQDIVDKESITTYSRGSERDL